MGASHIYLQGCNFDLKSIGIPLVGGDSDNRYLFVLHCRLGVID